MNVPVVVEDSIELRLESHVVDRLRAVASDATTNIGARLVTISLWRPASEDLVRVFSSMPEIYRVGGISRELGSEWVRLCVQQNKSFLAEDESVIMSDAFEHKSVLSALNLGSAINAVITTGRHFLGCLNLLDLTGTYTKNNVAQAGDIALQLADVLEAVAADLKYDH